MITVTDLLTRFFCLSFIENKQSIEQSLKGSLKEEVKTFQQPRVKRAKERCSLRMTKKDSLGTSSGSTPIRNK